MNFPESVLYYGSLDPLPERTLLRAGPVTLFLEGADLRYIQLGNHEILRRVYVALRDPNWNTIPAHLSNWQVDIQPRTFRISFDAEHIQGEINFLWKGLITGHEDGTISYKMDGLVRNDFMRSRIGFCILHGLECAGKQFEALHPDGTISKGTLPVYVSPHAPVMDLRTFKHEVEPGVWAQVEFAGDVFEMEDQRNWTDASFKTYSTPLALPWPVQVKTGDKVSQRIRLSPQGKVGARAPQSPDNVITIDTGASIPLPSIGLGVASHDTNLTEREIQSIAALALTHLRVDLDLASSEYPNRLALAADQARRLGVGLEVGLTLPDAPAGGLKSLREVLGRLKPPVRRWLIFQKRDGSGLGSSLYLARRALAGYDQAAQFGGGTNSDLVSINRNPPPVNALDFLFYSVNAQVHAFDLASLAETLEAQAISVLTARQLSGGKPVFVTPITLRPRFNSAARGPEPLTPPGELPWPVDPRQMSLFGASWTVGSMKYVSEAGAAGITYFETTGWRGVMETEQGPLVPDKFPSVAGMHFPLYHVLADVSEMKDGTVVRATSNNPLTVNALALRQAQHQRILVNNLSAGPCRVTIQNVEASSVRVSRLNETTAEHAMLHADEFRRQHGDVVLVKDKCLSLSLLPFEVARADYLNSH